MTTNRTIKVGELTGALLDYYVAMAGEEWKTAHQHYPTMTLDPTFSGVELRDYPRAVLLARIARRLDQNGGTA